MTHLLSANLLRLRKNLMFWVSVLAMLLFTLYKDVFVEYTDFLRYPEYHSDVNQNELFFLSAAVAGVLSAVVASLFLGADFSSGGLRNKLIAGNRRSSVYLANYLTVGMASTVIWLTTVAGTAALLPLLFGKPIEPTVYPLLGLSLLCVWSMAAVLTWLGMSIPNQAISAVTALLLLLAVIVLCMTQAPRLMAPEQIAIDWKLTETGEVVEIYGQNPYYLGGVSRRIVKALLCFLPGGQNVAMMYAGCVEPGYLAIGAAVSLVCSTLAGLFFFKRKDLK